VKHGEKEKPRKIHIENSVLRRSRGLPRTRGRRVLFFVGRLQRERGKEKKASAQPQRPDSGIRRKERRKEDIASVILTELTEKKLSREEGGG